MKPSFALPIVFAFALFCLPTTAQAADAWMEVRSPHFAVVGNAGEKGERRIADQFEEIRAVFHRFFPSLRIDPGKPFVVIALKNEESTKVLLPDYWISKDRVRPAGMYLPTFDRDFAVVRSDVSGTGENPYHLLYHEYTHAIMRLNFSALPIWLNEGLAEFYGNTIIDSHETQVGQVSPRQLSLLQRSHFIPLDQLMSADPRSPLYNERDQATIFYAESWAIVHYLMLDPEARKQHYFEQYLKAWQEKHDGAEAARAAFGDLTKFQTRIDRYAHESGFYYERAKPEAHFSNSEYSTRAMTPAESLVMEADFLQRTAHVNEARPMIEEALKLEPNLAAAHAALGYHHYTQFNNDEATKEFKQAADLDPHDFRAFYYLASITLRKEGYAKQAMPRIVSYLEKTVELNPDFAPAYAFLSVAYRQQRETREKALSAGYKANHLEPASLAYVVDVGEALLALNRDAEARTVGEQLDKAASAPQEKAIAQSYAKLLARHLELAKKKQPQDASKTSDANEGAPHEEALDMPALNEADSGPAADKAGRPQTVSEEGLIREIDCASSPGAKIKFAILGETLELTFTDLAKIEYRAKGKSSDANTLPCSQWKGRKAKITFKTGDGASSREVTAVDFF